MMLRTLATEQLPAYHEGMLLVKLRPLSAPVPPTLATSFASMPGSLRAPSTFEMGGVLRASENVYVSPGLSALSMFERAGMIKRVTPVSHEPSADGTGVRRRGVLATLAGVAAPQPVPDPNAGVSLIEMERDSDVPNLQVALANDPSVEFASRVPIRYLAARRPSRQASTPSAGSGATIAAAPPSPSTMWNLRKIHWQDARALGTFKDANEVRVAVLDTGIDRDHPDLVGRVSDYTFLHPDLPLASGERDIVGHGTHVAGTIAASINNDLGINGICTCRLSIWKIFDDKTEFFGDSFEYAVEPVMYLRALGDCLNQGVDVINLSIGGPGRPDLQEQALFDALLAQGTVIVAAMGNERQLGSPTSFPAAIPGVIAVGATTLDDTVANFSNRGNHISVCAPGVAIWSTLPTTPGQLGFQAVRGHDGRFVEGRPIPRETDYDAWPGTSMASPHVAAGAALLIANRGKASPESVRDELQRAADPVPLMGGSSFHPDYGAGRLNLLSLLSD